MANGLHIALLKQGVADWNEHRKSIRMRAPIYETQTFAKHICAR